MPKSKIKRLRFFSEDFMRNDSQKAWAIQAGIDMLASRLKKKSKEN